MNESEYETMFRVEERHWWYRGLRALVREHLPRIPGTPTRVLDVGCGTGVTMAVLAPECAVSGLDYSPLALERCRRRGRTGLVRGDAGALPHAAASFDAVLLLDVLYHRGVSDRAGVLAEARRVLKPHGILITNVPAYQWLYSSHDAAVHTAHRFTKREVRSLLRAAGFQLGSLSYWNSILFPPAAMVRLLRRNRPGSASDLEDYKSGATGHFFGAILAIERALMRLTPLPFGLSVFAVAKKAEE